MDALLIAPRRRPVDALATCAHPQAGRLLSARGRDRWRTAEIPQLLGLACALAEGGARVLVHEVEGNGDLAHAGCDAPGLVVVAFDHILHTADFEAAAAQARARWPGASLAAAGRFAASAADDAATAFEGIAFVGAFDAVTGWRPARPYVGSDHLLASLAGRRLERTPLARRPLRARCAAGEIIAASIVNRERSPGALAAEIAELSDATTSFVLADPVSQADLPSLACGLEEALAATRIDVSVSVTVHWKTGLALQPPLETSPAGGRSRIGRIVLVCEPQDLCAASAALEPLVRAGARLQPIVRIAGLGDDAGTLASRLAALRAAGIERLTAPALTLNGLEFAADHLDTNGPVIGAAELLRRAREGRPIDTPDCLPWSDPRTALFWTLLRPRLARLHEQATGWAPALTALLQRSADDPLAAERRRALRRWRMALGQTVLVLAEEAGRAVSRIPAPDPDALAVRLDTLTREVEQRCLGMSLDALVDIVLAHSRSHARA